MKILLAIPVFRQFEYARKAALSGLEHTPDSSVLVVDDASPDYDRQDWRGWPKENVHRHRFHRNKGVTRSWNFSLRYARDRGFEYAALLNSDVILTPGWFGPIEWALNNGVDLAGPVTNAPGHQDRQRVSHFLEQKYKATDDPAKLAEVAGILAEQHPQKFKPCRINGFCMVAKTATWWRYPHSPDDVFDPKHAMTRNEDEFQGRIGKKDMVSAAVPASFVFHYRGVSRKGATGGKQGRGWFRPPTGAQKKKKKDKK